MDDKRAFKILASISVIMCIVIVIFNAWIAPNMVPTYKEYDKIFSVKLSEDEKNIEDKHEDDEDDNIDEEDNENDNIDEEDNEEDDDNNYLLVNINEADIDELMSIPYIGEVIAERIIDYRNENGPFEDEEELLNISGIGEKKLNNIINYITVE